MFDIIPFGLIVSHKLKSDHSVNIIDINLCIVDVQRGHWFTLIAKLHPILSILVVVVAAAAVVQYALFVMGNHRSQAQLNAIFSVGIRHNHNCLLNIFKYACRKMHRFLSTFSKIGKLQSFLFSVSVYIHFVR